MTPSWNNLRHPFASTSNPSAGPSTRERRTSKGYEESDFSPPPQLPSTFSSRDSGRFSDAAVDESVDPGLGGFGGDMPDFSARRDKEGGDGLSRQREGANDVGYGLGDGQVGSSRTRYTESGRYNDSDPTRPLAANNNPYSAYAPYQPPNQNPYHPSREYSLNNPSSSLSPSQSFPYTMDQYSSPPQGYADSPRDRLPSSASYNSMSASVRGRRAPVPAPLDLSPRSEKVRRDAGEMQGDQYTGLGLGMPMAHMEGQARRVLTDSSLRVRLYELRTAMSDLFADLSGRNSVKTTSPTPSTLHSRPFHLDHPYPLFLLSAAVG